MNRVFGLCIVLMLTSVPAALAGDRGHGWLGPVCWPDCLGRRCCDDYDVKPLPCPWPVKCFECDDYCPRPLPCIVPIKKFCPDDYCPKCPPPVCGPPRGDLVCPPPMCPKPAFCAPTVSAPAAVRTR
ncbi:MAG: hypothetical protein J5I93_23905 [Pirellulaceae bacterium]|nr:hypothetical protein [Pirellulaceae bacterium]